MSLLGELERSDFQARNASECESNRWALKRSLYSGLESLEEVETFSPLTWSDMEQPGKWAHSLRLGASFAFK